MLAQVPSQVHVVYGGTPYEYVVSWVNLQTNGTRKSFVEYGYSISDVSSVAAGVPKVFTEDRCQTERILHDVVISPIKPNTQIFYRVSSGQGTPVSPIFNFYAIDREIADPTRPFYFTSWRSCCDPSCTGVFHEYAC